jgi:hypothetical protein
MAKDLDRRSVLRAALITGGALIAPASLADRADAAPAPGRPAALTAGSAAQTASYDALQRFTHLIGGGNGIVYAVQADGALMWFQHTDWATGGPNWANNGTGVQLAGSSGWQGLRAAVRFIGESQLGV